MVKLAKRLLPFVTASERVRPVPLCIALFGFLLLSSSRCVEGPDSTANSREGEKVLSFDTPPRSARLTQERIRIQEPGLAKGSCTVTFSD